MIFLWLLSLIALGAITWFYLGRQRLLKYVKHVPTSPEEYPLVGISYRFFRKNTEQIMKTFIDLNASIDTPTRFWFGPQLVIALDKPEDIAAILTSPNCYEKSHVYRFFHNDLGLFSSTTNIWKHDRKLLSPTLNTKAVISFLPIFNEKSNLMIQNIEKELNCSEPFDLSSYLFACTLDMVCATTLGYSVDVQINKNRFYLESWEKCIKMVATRMLNVHWHPDIIYKLTNAYKKEKVQFDIAEGLANSIVIKKKKEYMENMLNGTNQNGNDDNDEDTEFYAKPKIFIDELLKLYGKGLINDERLFQQVNMLIFGGNDTSALVISHTILMLAMHPDIQEKVMEEISDIYDSDDQYSSLELISKLNYTEMVIREAMRLFPVAPFLARRALEDTKIKNCNNCVIPKDTLIIISIWGVHRSTAIWGPNANRYDPENFRPEKVAARPPYSYIPWSGGPRNCIAMKYALMSMKVMITALLRNYKFTTDLKYDDLKTKFEITMKLVNGHMVKVERRNFKK